MSGGPGAASGADRRPGQATRSGRRQRTGQNPVTVLEEQAKSRVPDLIPIRYGRMIASPFAYFRGAAAPMAWDLAQTPTPDIRVQACGDAHLLNFGMYAAPDRRLVFDVNDFDETLPAPFEWDVKRLAASFAVAARDNGFNDRDARTAARLAVRSYRTEIAGYAAMPFLKVWYSRIDIDEVSRQFDALQPKAAVRRRHRDIGQAYRRTSLSAFLRMCDLVEGQYRIRSAHPVIVRFPIERYPGVLEDLRSAIALYQHTLEADRREVLRRYYFGDFARKVVGVGSVGTEAFVVLLIGDRADEPYLFRPAAATSPFSPCLTGSWPGGGHAPFSSLSPVAARFARTAVRVKGRGTRSRSDASGALDVPGGERIIRRRGRGGPWRAGSRRPVGLGWRAPPGCRGQVVIGSPGDHAAGGRAAGQPALPRRAGSGQSPVT